MTQRSAPFSKKDVFGYARRMRDVMPSKLVNELIDHFFDRVAAFLLKKRARGKAG